jgi:hypothetical protein
MAARTCRSGARLARTAMRSMLGYSHPMVLRQSLALGRLSLLLRGSAWRLRRSWKIDADNVRGIVGSGQR